MMFCIICNTINAIMGEKSSPPSGGIHLLKIFRYKSVICRRVCQGWSSQRILGIQLKKILNIIKKKYKLNILLIPCAMLNIFYPFYNCELCLVKAHSQLLRSRGIFSIILNSRDLRFCTLLLKTSITAWCETGGTSPTSPAS